MSPTRCPQNCEYCYNKGRTGRAHGHPHHPQAIDDLRDAGVAWLGLTGGEPLLNPDLVEIVAHASADMAVKLFTTGVGLTPQLAEDLADAGLFSVAVSLDHWEPARHDASRRYEGAFDAALKAISIFKEVPGLHVSVSSVLSREAIRNGEVEKLVSFLDSLGVDEAWLSEVKPTVSDFWSDELVITEEERRQLVRLQDDHNRELRSSKRAARHGGQLPGPLRRLRELRLQRRLQDGLRGRLRRGEPLRVPADVLRQRAGAATRRDLGRHAQPLPGRGRCFVNQNYRKLSTGHGVAPTPGPRVARVGLLERVKFGPPAEFNRRLYGRRAGA